MPDPEFTATSRSLQVVHFGERTHASRHVHHGTRTRSASWLVRAHLTSSLKPYSCTAAVRHTPRPGFLRSVHARATTLAIACIPRTTAALSTCDQPPPRNAIDTSAQRYHRQCAGCLQAILDHSSDSRRDFAKESKARQAKLTSVLADESHCEAPPARREQDSPHCLRRARVLRTHRNSASQGPVWLVQQLPEFPLALDARRGTKGLGPLAQAERSHVAKELQPLCHHLGAQVFQRERFVPIAHIVGAGERFPVPAPDGAELNLRVRFGECDEITLQEVPAHRTRRHAGTRNGGAVRKTWRKRGAASGGRAPYATRASAPAAVADDQAPELPDSTGAHRPRGEPRRAAVARHTGSLPLCAECTLPHNIEPTKMQHGTHACKSYYSGPTSRTSCIAVCTVCRPTRVASRWRHA